MIMEILNICMEKGCQVWSVKEGYRLGDDIQSKVLAFAFGRSAEIERKLAHVQNPVLRIERKYVPLCVEPKVCEYVIRTLQGSAAHGPTRCAIGLL